MGEHTSDTGIEKQKPSRMFSCFVYALLGFAALSFFITFAVIVPNQDAFVELLGGDPATPVVIEEAVIAAISFDMRAGAVPYFTVKDREGLFQVGTLEGKTAFLNLAVGDRVYIEAKQSGTNYSVTKLLELGT